MGAEFWESVTSYARQMKKDIAGHVHGHYGRDKHWDDGVDMAEALERSVCGDPSLVSLATETMHKFQLPIDDALRSTYVRGVQGSRVSVPAYLGGSNEAMLRRVRAERPVPHVNIFLGLVSSCGISAQQLLK